MVNWNEQVARIMDGLKLPDGEMTWEEDENGAVHEHVNDAFFAMMSRATFDRLIDENAK